VAVADRAAQAQGLTTNLVVRGPFAGPNLSHASARWHSLGASDLRIRIHGASGGSYESTEKCRARAHCAAVLGVDTRVDDGATPNTGPCLRILRRADRG